jgi:hypothetical protein
MKRSPMPRSTKPLARRAELNHGSQLERKAPIRQQSAKKRATRRTWEQFRRDVYDRAQGICDRCASWIPWGEGYECHHRRLRSQGGRDEMSNLLALHKFPCHAFVHDNRAWARKNGFIVHRPDVPAKRPVYRHLRSWELPTETWTPSAPPEEVAA